MQEKPLKPQLEAIKKNIPFYKKEYKKETEHFQSCVDRDYERIRRDDRLTFWALFILGTLFIKSSSGPLIHVETNIGTKPARGIANVFNKLYDVRSSLNNINTETNDLYERVDDMIVIYEKAKNQKNKGDK